MPRTFHCVIYLLGSIRNHSVSQRAFASQHGEKAHGFALYGRHRVAGIKGRLCFIKRKYKQYISNDRNFKQKNTAFLRRKRTDGKNLWTFSRFESCFVFFFSRFSGKSGSLSILATAALLARVDTPPNGHAPAHRALNDFAFLAFTLHPCT